ncbi:MAG: nucleoside deaminase [Ferruginibacter sp.]
MKDDSFYMDICTRLANAAKIKGNPAVGCVIVKNGELIAEAEETSVTKGDITCHAEIEAIRAAVKKIGKDLSHCTLYTTHEPCIMCAYPIRYHAIARIVIHSPVVFFGGINSEFALLTTTNVPAHWSAPPGISWFDKSIV